MVFSNQAVVKHINANFVPVALKAGSVKNPPDGIEGELYRELRRTQAAPQGICVMNSAGKVLDWVLSFDDDQAIPAFFDEVRQRYDRLPRDQQPVLTRRFRSYPSRTINSIADTGQKFQIPDRHENEECPAKLKPRIGSLVGTVVGRPLDPTGKPIARTLRQEDYMEATFEISRFAIDELVEACNSSADEVEVPDLLVGQIIGPAYLGQLDVSPLTYTPTANRRNNWWRFRGKLIDADNGSLIRITGQSHISGSSKSWDHAVTLDWQGYIRLTNGKATRIDLIGKGHEILSWGIGDISMVTEPAAAHLMAGHPINFKGNVIYGLTASAH